MELVLSRKIPKNVDVIATFSDNTRYVYYQESKEDELMKKLKKMDPAKIKKMITEGSLDKEEILNLLESNDKANKYLSNDKKTFEFKDKDVMVMPTISKERELIYIFGVSGSGKSYFTKMYSKLYKKVNKKNEIFVISCVENDPSFEGMKYTHIPLDMEILEKIDLNTFQDSLVIFDDCDTPKDKVMMKFIDAMKDDIAQRGRHHNVSAIFTTHMACNFLRTRVLLSECDKFVIFPGSGGIKQQEYMVVNYGGMDKSFFKTIRDLKSRWVCFNVRYPNYIVYQNGVKLLG